MFRKTNRKFIRWEYDNNRSAWFLWITNRRLYRISPSHTRRQLWDVTIPGNMYDVLSSHSTSTKARKAVEERLGEDLVWMVNMIQLTDQRTMEKKEIKELDDNELRLDLQSNC